MMSYLLPVALVAFLVGMFVLSVRNKRVWVRVVGGLLVVILTVFFWNLLRRVERYYEISYYQDALQQLRTAIESGKAQEALVPLREFESHSSDDNWILTNFGGISKLDMELKGINASTVASMDEGTKDSQ